MGYKDDLRHSVKNKHNHCKRRTEETKWCNYTWGWPTSHRGYLFFLRTCTLTLLDKRILFFTWTLKNFVSLWLMQCNDWSMASEYEYEFGNSSIREVELDILPATEVFHEHILIPTGILITIVNLFSFVALYRCSRLCFQIRILAMNLCLSDLFTGTSLVVPPQFYYYNNCVYKKFLTSTFVVVSSFTVTMMNLDRCLAIHYGIRYYIYMNKKVLISLCASFWVLSIPLVYLLYLNMETSLGISCRPILYVAKNLVTISVSVILLASIVSNLLMFVFLVRTLQMSAGRSPYTKDKRYAEQARVIRK